MRLWWSLHGVDGCSNVSTDATLELGDMRRSLCLRISTVDTPFDAEKTVLRGHCYGENSDVQTFSSAPDRTRIALRGVACSGPQRAIEIRRRGELLQYHECTVESGACM